MRQCSVQIPCIPDKPQQCQRLVLCILSMSFRAKLLQSVAALSQNVRYKHCLNIKRTTLCDNLGIMEIHSGTSSQLQSVSVKKMSHLMSEHHFNQCGRSLTCELSVVVQHVKKEGQETFLIVSCHPMHLKAAKENNLDQCSIIDHWKKSGLKHLSIKKKGKWS